MHLGQPTGRILDATTVRCLLVPARMAIVGRRDWYLPRGIDRLLPRISIEGGEYFKKRDRRAGEQPSVEPEPAGRT